MASVEIWVAMDEEGNVSVTTDVDVLGEKTAELGSDNGTYAVRVVKLVLNMEPPEVQDVEVDIPDEAGRRTTATVA